jgi:hypothetical protein
MAPILPLVQIDPAQTALALMSSGLLPANSIASYGGDQGPGRLGSCAPSQTIMSLLSSAVTEGSRTLGSVSPSANVAVSPTFPETIIASITGTTLTVVAVVGLGALGINTNLAGPTVPQNTTIVALGSGTGGAGTYTVSAPGVTTFSVPQQLMACGSGFAG